MHLIQLCFSILLHTGYTTFYPTLFILFLISSIKGPLRLYCKTKGLEMFQIHGRNFKEFDAPYLLVSLSAFIGIFITQLQLFTLSNLCTYIYAKPK